MMLKIRNTDHLFKDSPNAGEPDCKCSRCKRLIKENETVARSAMNSSDLVAVNKNTGEEINLGDKPVLDGLSLEFRLCVDCNLNWLRQTTGQAIGLCAKAIERCPDNFQDQINFIRKHGGKF